MYYLNIASFGLRQRGSFSYYDAIANVFGAVLGVTLFWSYLFVAVKRVSQRRKVSM